MGTLGGKGAEVVDMLERRNLEILCLQETKWKGDRARMLGRGFKLLHAGGDGKSNGVGIVVSEAISKEVIRVERWEGRILMAWLMVRGQMVCIMSVYGPQTGRSKEDKEAFRDALERMIGLVGGKEMLCVAGDFNVHVGVREDGEEECMGNFGWGVRNREGKQLVELLVRNGLAVAGSFFQKRDNHKITYRSGGHKTQLDLLVVRGSQLMRVKDCKAIAGEYVATQHKLLVFVVRMGKRAETRTRGQKVIRWWKCKGDLATCYRERVEDKYKDLSVEVGDVEEEWKKFKDAFVGTAEQICGRTTGKGGSARKVNQGWWTEDVKRAVNEKREVWKKIEGRRDRGEQTDVALRHLYGQKKKAASRAVERARANAEASIYRQLEEDGGKKAIYRMSRERKEDGKDVKGGRVIKDKDGKLVTDKEEVLRVWEEYFKDLLNQGVGRELELPSAVRGRVEVKDITYLEVKAAIGKMKRGKAVGVDEVRVEMLIDTGEVAVSWLGRLFKVCLREGKIPREWQTGLIVPIWKRKGDVHDPGKYRGITLLSHVLKLLERILDRRIRGTVEPEIGEEQQGFRGGRGTADGMFALRQLVEKRLEMQRRMALGFVDLEKAYDTVPRELVFATLRWMGVPEAEVRLVEGIYDGTKARVVVDSGLSSEFGVGIGLRQGSALSPLLFIMVMELISRKASTKSPLRKMLYADDLAVVMDSKEELQMALSEWKELFERHGLRMSLDKTEVVSVGKDREELNITLGGEAIKQVESFVYLGGAICGDGRSEVEVRRRIQSGALAWKNVEGVMADRRISRKLKGKVLATCVTPACLYGLETVPLSREQQGRLQVCENNWVRRIGGVVRADRREMVGLREEIGLQGLFTEKLIRSRLKWAGHVERMDEGRLPKMAMSHVDEGSRRRGRPSLRWKDCVVRDFRNTGEGREGGDWRTLTGDRGRWRAIVSEASSG